MNFFLFGKAGTGKDTVAMLMGDYFDYYSLALADPIRSEYKRFFGTDDYRTNRQKLIDIGEIYKQLYGQDVWCKQAIEGIHTLAPIKPVGFLVRDGRYDHEYEFFVYQQGFIPIRLVADDRIRLQRLLDRDGVVQADALEFESENFIKDYFPALELENNGTVDELLDNINALMVHCKNESRWR